MIKGFLSYVYWAWKTTRKMSISFKYFDIRWRGNAFIVLLFHLPWGRLNSTESLPWKDSISSLWPLPPLFWIGKRRGCWPPAGGKSKDTAEIEGTCSGLLPASGALRGIHSVTFWRRQHLIRVPSGSVIKACGEKGRSCVSRQKGSFYTKSCHYTYHNP